MSELDQELTLFLGFPVQNNHLKVFDSLSPEFRSLYVKKDSEYLQQVKYQGVTYLGKFLSHVSTSEEIHLLERNIYSLLHKMLLHPELEQTSLVLFSPAIGSF